MSRRWRVYYDDIEPVAGSSDAEAYALRTTGVQCIAVENPARVTGWGIVTGRDAYLYREGRFWACDQAGVWDHLYFYEGPKCILFGRTIPTKQYDKIMARATKEGLGG